MFPNGVPDPIVTEYKRKCSDVETQRKHEATQDCRQRDFLFEHYLYEMTPDMSGHGSCQQQNDKEFEGAKISKGQCAQL